ncbi:MAG: Gfo/Idh/MocA family oxidoreductase [Planctomycetota bacterium]
MKALRVAVIGAGDMAGMHARAWAKAPGARIVAVCDTQEGRAEALAKEHGAKALRDYREAIAGEGVNAVSVCVPAGLHAEVTVEAAGRGCDVLCEKPMALSIEEADRMIRAAQAGGVKLMIGLCHRFFRTQELAREIVGRGEIGSPRHYHYAAVAGVRPKIAMHDRHGNGGPIVDILCHYADDMERVLGSRVTRVYARGHTFAAKHPKLETIAEKAVDTAAAVLDFANGDTGTFIVTWGAPAELPWIAQQEVWGPMGVLRIRPNEAVELAQASGTTVYEGLTVEHIDREVAHFASCVREDEPVGADGETGRRLLKLSLAALESIAGGARVVVGGEGREG